mmetsp:Transcript_31254/g.70337  ORF Transcript_31254/g.70337 Transcript_31254/m.70337 type:complete len:87 (+) Transcript_31254:2543-2803(+)
MHMAPRQIPLFLLIKKSFNLIVGHAACLQPLPPPPQVPRASVILYRISSPSPLLPISNVTSEPGAPSSASSNASSSTPSCSTPSIL